MEATAAGAGAGAGAATGGDGSGLAPAGGSPPTPTPTPASGRGGRGRGEDRDDWRVLVEDWSFPEELARQCQDCGTAGWLIKLAASGFEISEGDPLLMGVVNVADADSVAYASQGNYGLAAGSPGHLPWPGGAPPALGAPLPAGVAAAPPHALASFIRSMPGVVDKADGVSGLVFYVENNCRLHEIPLRLQGTNQFRRLGPQVSGFFGAAVDHPELVRFYTLDRMNWPPQAYPSFTKTA